MRSLILGILFALTTPGHSATNHATVRAVVAVETNFFVTFSPSEFSHAVTPQKIEEARRSKESRPAARDPEGNWGELAEGFQLSVRFEKDAFKANEPIVATVLIRNAIQRKVFYRDFVGMREDSPVCQFVVLDEQQKPVPRLDQRAPDDITDGPHIPRELNPGTQRRYQVRLNEKFKLSTPGTYSIRVRRWVRSLTRDGYSQIKSGVATIKVTGTAP